MSFSLNTIKRFFFSVFPKPRSAVRFGGALPLLIFLAVFAAVCVTLELTNTLLFARPKAFGLMLFTVWIWWMSVVGFSGLSRGRSLLALTVRLSLAGLFVMLLAEPRAVRTRDVLSVVFAIDYSESINDEAIDHALGFVAKTVSEKPKEEDEAGLIVFGRNAAVELPPRTSFPFEAVNSRIDRDATNLEQSLSLAAAMLPEQNRGRIVLISDGTQTEGSLARILDQLKAREISVDVLPIEYGYENEVWLERLELPRYVKIGENYEASTVLSSLKGGEGQLVLKENDNVIYEETIKFQPGKNRYTIPIKLREPGYYEYTASIKLPEGKDNLDLNNEVLNYIFVEGEGKALVVVNPLGEDRDWQYLVKAMEEGKRSVTRVSAYDFPRDSLSLMPYDSIVFVNVPADAFDAVQMQSVKDAVYNLGVGFMMVGGDESFGPGGYHRSVIEETLPVTMDVTKKKILPKGALAIILHTCEFPQGNTWGKRITKQAIKVLGDQDEIGVLVYDYQGGESWLFELTPAGDYEKLVPKIHAAQIGDMPSFASTMRMGLAGLKKSDAATKHMIIISDGDPSPPPPPLVQEFIDAKVSVSMVAVFPHGGQEISKMRAIAGATGGRYYFPADPNLLPSIFIKEAKTLKRSMIQNKTFLPEGDFPSSIMKGIESVPELHGYVLTTPKSRAEVVLKAPIDDPEVDDIDPVLATWKYGLGTTAAFTSDLSSNWGKDWMDWDQYRAFVKQLMTKISRVRKEGHLRMWNYTTGNEGVIIVEDYHRDDSFLEVRALVAGPRGRRENIVLRQISPRRYQATVPLWGKGRYQVMAIGKAGERTDQAAGGFIVPYSPEYLRFRSNPIVLDQIAEKTGGMRLDESTKAAEVFGRRAPKSSDSPIFDWFIIALACLIPLDVAIRRIQIDLVVIKQWLGLGPKRKESTQTMGALLERKQAVSSTLDRQYEQTAATTSRPVRPRRTKPRRSETTAPPTREPVQAQAADMTNMSTTERLLAMKQRRQHKPQDEE